MSTLKFLGMQLFAIIFKETCQLTPMTYHFAINILGKIEASLPSQLVHQQKMPEQSNFLGNEYVFLGIKGTCKNVSQKKEKIISPSNNSFFNVLYITFNHTILWG